MAASRNRPLDAVPYAFVWVDALTRKVREDGRTINVAALAAVGVNADGHREILGLSVATTEDGAGRLAFLRPRCRTTTPATCSRKRPAVGGHAARLHPGQAAVGAT